MITTATKTMTHEKEILTENQFEKSKSLWGDAWDRLIKDKVALTSLIVIGM